MKNEQAIKNFLSTMDMSMTMVEQFKNAKRDAQIYKWSYPTIREIIKGIEKAYMKKNVQSVMEKRKDMIESLGAQ